MKFAMFIFHRLLASVPVLIGVVLITFVLMRILPGDPALFFASSPSADPAEIEEIRRDLGLDKSLVEQLAIYFRDVLTGNLGKSLTTGQPVFDDLVERLPASMELTLVAIVLAVAISLPLGIAAALYEGTWIDHVTRIVSSIGVSLPTFVTGLILIYVFYFKLGWASQPTDRIDIFITEPHRVTGFLLIDALIEGNWEAFSSAAGRLILPSITMVLFVLSPLTRMTRASMLGVLSEDFVRTAKASGLSWWTVVVRYAFRSAFIPVLTTLGLIFSYLLGANVLVERVFSWPGVGSYALKAMEGSDYAPVQGYVLLMGLIFVITNLVIDILYGLIDPRVRIS